jgi:hypothetical protein
VPIAPTTNVPCETATELPKYVYRPALAVGSDRVAVGLLGQFASCLTYTYAEPAPEFVPSAPTIAELAETAAA